MGLEVNPTNIVQLNTAWPLSTDLRTEGDDHLRNIKLVLKTTWPNFSTGAVTATPAEHNCLLGARSSLQEQIDAITPTSTTPKYANLFNYGPYNFVSAGALVVSLPWSTSVFTNGVTAEITGIYAGLPTGAAYAVSYSFVYVIVAPGTGQMRAYVTKNGLTLPASETTLRTASTTDYQSASGLCMFTAAPNDVLEFKLESPASAWSLNIHKFSMNILKVS